MLQRAPSKIHHTLKMKAKADRTVPRSQNRKQIRGDGTNWVLIAGGALLSTLSIRLGYKLKQALETKHSDNSKNVKSTAKRGSEDCPWHSNTYGVTQDKDGCYHCFSGVMEGMGEIKRPSISSMSKEPELILPLVKIPAPGSTNNSIWATSPERLSLPQKPFHHSNSSDSLSVSESGSDIFSKREVIHKLRQQLKRRDDMILEMQDQIADLRDSLSSQLAHSTHLQDQLDSANGDLFDLEREIQWLRKAIADHCVGAMVGSTGVGRNGYCNGERKFESEGVDVGEGRGGDVERVEMLKREVGELKEVIEGKDFLVKSYKEQKIELCSKMKDLELRVASHIPNIL